MFPSLKSFSFVYLVLLLVAALPNGKTQVPPDMKLLLENLIEEAMAKENVPALGLAIVKNNGEIVYARGYGLRDVENGIAANEATKFGIGSISKSFTATVVVKALNEIFPQLGERALDTPIRALAPSYNFTLGDRYRSEEMTLRDLMSHRTCLSPEILGGILMPFVSSGDFLFRQRYAPEQCSFRTGYVYNGIIEMAGDIIAHVANSTFEEMLSSLFNDLGMSDSTWVKETDDHNNMPDRSIPYYQLNGELNRFNPELLKGATIALGTGGLISSPRDMAKYLQFHLNRGKVGTVQVVPEEVMQWLYKPSNLMFADAISDLEDIENRYASGLGLHLGVYQGKQTVTHGGFLPPYDSLLTLMPELELGIFTTTSGPGKPREFTRSVLHRRIYKIVQGIQAVDEPAIHQGQDQCYLANAKVALPSTRTSVRKLDPSEIVGKFGSGFSGQLEINPRLNSIGVQQPYLSYGVWGQAWLAQVNNATFLIDWESDITHVFATRGGVGFGMVVDFLDKDTLRFVQDGMQFGNVFVRNLTIEHLPRVPWAPDSCGPEQVPEV